MLSEIDIKDYKQLEMFQPETREETKSPMVDSRPLSVRKEAFDKISKVYVDACSREYPEPLQTQVGGDHYKRFAIQPAEYAFHNHLEFLPANIIKYVTRYPFKNGLQDLEKALHCLQMLIQLEKSKND